MKISNIEAIPVRHKGGLFGFCSFIIDDAYYVGGVALYTRPSGGIRCVYPTRKVGDRDIPIHHPITREAGQMIEDTVSRTVAELSLLEP